MAMTKEEIGAWFDTGVAMGHTHLIIACATLDHSPYPVYVGVGVDPRARADELRGGQSMQKVMEVYNLREDRDIQLDQGRIFNYGDEKRPDEPECHHHRITKQCFICNPTKPLTQGHPQPDLDNLFTHHPPFGDQIKRYQVIRTAGKDFATVILSDVPPSPERSTAIRKIREAIMWANAGIACNEEEKPDEKHT